MKSGDFRPVNGLIAFLCVLSGGFVSGSINRDTFLIALSVFFLVLGGNGINDIFDMEIDRVNRPERPLPSGRVSRGLWTFLTVLFFVIALLPIIPAGVHHITIAGIYIILLSLYTPLFKPVPLLGNLVIAFLGGFTFVWGGLAGGNVLKTIYPGVFAFLIHLSREIVKDVEDLEGDRKAGLRTLPMIIGKDKSILISFLILLVLFFTVVSSLWFYNVYYIFGMVVLVLIPLAVILYTGLRKQPEPGVLQKRLKILMVSGLIAITLGGL